MKMKNRKVKRGFTLIELVMVVGILGILSSVALVKFTDVQKNAKVNADYVAASNIANAAKLAIESGVTITELSSLKTEGYLEGIVEPQSVDGTFVIAVDDKTKAITVKVDGTVFYPKEQASAPSNE